MHDLWTMLSNVFLYVAQASAYSIATIIIISLVQLVGRRWIPAKWSYALWLILLVRMTLPSGFESRLSLWNLVPSNTLALMPSEADWQIRLFDQSKLSSPLHDESHIQGNVGQNLQYGKQGESKSASIMPTLWRLIPAVWFGGVLLLLTIITFSNLRLWLSVRKLRLVTEQPLIELLEDCKQLINVRTVVGLATTDRVKSPSLFGFVRPRILIPAGLQNHIPMEEMQYIFLHELAHLKRGDIWIGWIVAVLQSLHWFNPMVWWAFIRMRADRELACDALALSYLPKKESGRYGGTLLNLLEWFSSSETVPIVAGILENKAQLKRRLKMITQFAHPTRRAGIVAVMLMAVLSAALLTDAKDNSLLTQEQNMIDPPKSPPIKVGGGVQQSKLIYKVEPEYPESAKAVGLSGKVVLQVTVNERGHVSDVEATEGHPVLSNAATAAVGRWRYSTTLLSGEPVPVTTTVTVFFSPGGAVDTAFNAEPSPVKNSDVIMPILIPTNVADPKASPGIRIKARPFASYQGRQYYTVVPGISGPELAIDKERLRELANAGWPTSGRETRAMMLFYLFIDEDGRIAGIRQMQGPKIAEIDYELKNIRVISPARFGEAVPSWVAVEIGIPGPSQIR